MSSRAPHHARVIQLRPATAVAEATRPARTATPAAEPGTDQTHRILRGPQPVPAVKEPLWRHIVGDVLRRERLAQERRLRDVADEARISMPYLSEIERGRKEASSEVLAAAAHALGLSLADLLALAQAELTRLTQPGWTRQAPRSGRPSQAITPAQPTPERDLDTETTVSPDGGNTPADQPSTADTKLAPGELGSAGADVAGETEADIADRASLAPREVGPAGVGVAGRARLTPGRVERAETGAASEAEVDIGGQARLVPGEVGPAGPGVPGDGETALSSWQVKLRLAA